LTNRGRTIAQWARMRRHRFTPLVRVTVVLAIAIGLPSTARAEPQTGSLPARSFSALQPLLTPGERVIVRDASGRTTKGRFVSLTESSLKVVRRGWTSRSEERTWTEGAVSRVQHEDSTWNGNVIGAAAGFVAIVVMVKSPRCDMRCLP